MSIDTEAMPSAGTAIPGESDPAPQINGGVTDGESDSGGDDTESRARAMGWVPQEEFRGPSDKWRDAAEFVRKGEEDLPVVRERLRDTTRKLTQLEQRLQAREQEFSQNYGQLERMTTVALQRQREQINASYVAAQRQAVELGDVARFDQLRSDQQQALHNFDSDAYQARQAPRQQPQQGPAPEEVPIVTAWQRSNPWFLHDAEMNSVAQAAHVRIGRENPNMSLQENLEKTTAYVRQRYPERFPQQPMRQATVEGGSRMAISSGARSKGAADLPADARRQGEKFVREGLFKDMSEYAREFWSQDQ